MDTTGVGTAVKLRFWAAAREAAGTAEEETRAGTLGEALSGAVAKRDGERGGRLALVLSRCSFVVDGDPVGRRDPGDVPLRPGAVVEVLPPFAGG